MKEIYITGYGVDSHKIINKKTKPLIIGGIEFDDNFTVESNSDGDVVLHAITNAISSITTTNILGEIADRMCKNGITDSKEYLKKSLEYLKNTKIIHVAISIEAKRPHFKNSIDKMRKEISSLLNIPEEEIGITATSGEGLTEFGKGNGIYATVIISCVKYV